MSTTYYVTHSGADYAYPHCGCDGPLNSLMEYAPPGMPIVGREETVPTDGTADHECVRCHEEQRQVTS